MNLYQFLGSSRSSSEAEIVLPEAAGSRSEEMNTYWLGLWE